MTVQTNTEPAGLTVLGATGTIGVNTLDIVRRHPGRFRVVALTAATQVERLYEQCACASVACRRRSLPARTPASLRLATRMPRW